MFVKIHRKNGKPASQAGLANPPRPPCFFPMSLLKGFQKNLAAGEHDEKKAGRARPEIRKKPENNKNLLRMVPRIGLLQPRPDRRDANSLSTSAPRNGERLKRCKFQF